MILTLRYFSWRVMITLPDLTMSFQSLWAWVFFIFEVGAITGLLIGLVFQSRTSNRSEEADQGVARLMQRDVVPSVDVFIATYNEELEVVERTIVGALSLDYPRYTVWVLDDGKREWLREFCEKKGAHYVTRPDNLYAKAGNINNGLAVSKEKSNADLIMVLDADFVPRSDFLWRTVGFFDDKKIGIVQTPQYFFNPDPAQANLLADRFWVDEQRYFFDIIQPSRDAWDVAFCCGTSSVVRRRYLEEVGGFPTDSVTEDMLLTFVFLQKGYITRYLRERLSIGLAPEGLKEYLTQRSRWCLGTLQILWLKSCPLWASGLNMTQRISFLWQTLNWVITFPWVLLCLLAPLIFLFTGVYAIETQGSDIIAYFAPAFVAVLMSISWVSQNKNLIIMTDATRLVMVFTILNSIYQGLFRPFGQGFKVTAKGGDRSQVVIHWQLLWKLIVLFLLSLTGITINLIPEYAVIENHDLFLANLFWSFFNIVIILIAALIAIDLPRQRSQERFAVHEPSKMILGGDQGVLCLIKDLSLSGARVQMNNKPLLSESVQLDVPGVGRLSCKINRHINTQEVAIQFSDLAFNRDAMIRKLYTQGYNNVSLRAKPLKLFIIVMRRIFGRDPA
ncbi:MAG: glycosyltransferase [Gammaproteobacteria bacterium]|nr:glycosyltransferase [Gammaproteobacteria bacterium]